MATHTHTHAHKAHVVYLICEAKGASASDRAEKKLTIQMISGGSWHSSTQSTINAPHRRHVCMYIHICVCMYVCMNVNHTGPM